MTEPENPQEAKSISRKILKASALILVAHLIFKVLGVFQARIIGQFCDSTTRDLFAFGFDGILMIFFLIGEESLGPALLPVFMEEKEKQGESAAWRFASIILSAQFILITFAVLAVMTAPSFFVNLITEWDKEGSDPAYARLAPQYARYMIIGLFGMSIGSTTYMLLNGYKRFFLAALGDAAVKLGIIAVLLVSALSGKTIDGMTAVATLSGGVILGSIFKLLTHLLGLRGEIRNFRPTFDFRNPAFRKFMLLVAPLIAGILFAKFRDAFNQIWVLSYVKESGLVAGNAWGRKIYQSIGTIVPYAVSIAMFPFFCEMVDRDRKDELGKMITTSSKLLLLICAPLAAMVVVLSMPLSQLLYQAGKFSYDDCYQVSVANACYSIVLPAYALEYILMQGFFSNRKMLSVTLVGLFFSTASMIISYVCIVHLGWTGIWALAAVALAFSLTRSFKVITLITLMRRFIPCFPLRESVVFLVRICIISLVCGLAAWGARSGYESAVDVTQVTRQKDVILRVGLDLAVSGLAGGVAFIIMTLALCREEAALISKWTLDKIKRKRNADK